MPIQFAAHTTPGGHRVLRSLSSGVLSAHDAQSLKSATAPGGPFHGLPLLAISAKDTTITPESRKAFVDFGNGPMLVAIVVDSTATRVMLNFIVKASLAMNKPGTAAGETKFFSSEPEATVWLDEKLGAAAKAG